MPSSSNPSSSTSLDLRWSSVWSSLPLSPGVYWFLDEHDVVLYVGKAKNLKHRVASYKRWQSTRGKTRKLVFQAHQLKHQVLDSEIEALLVEAELIRTHQPEFNILLKDDKTPLYIHITDEEFPRVLMIRKKDAEKEHRRGALFGPFQSSFAVTEVLHLAHKIFPYCSAPRAPIYGTPANTPCFDFHLEMCNGACIGLVTAEEYQQNIQQLKLFLRGQKKAVVRDVEHAMKAASDAENFELAAELRDRIDLIKRVTEKSYRLKPELHLPALKISKRAEGLIYLRRLLNTYLALPKTMPLTRIEGYDVSNIQGTNATVAQVTFINGEPAPAEYRLFNIRTLQTPNDFAMLQEALLRRQNHLEWGTPNLLVIDGGKGQLRSVLKIWQWHVPVIAIAKKPDRIIFPILKTVKGKEKPQLTYQEAPLAPDHPTLLMLQHIRDEAHRFSKKQHTRMRDRTMLE